MARGAPDGILRIQVAVTVENVPIVPEPATEYARDTYGIKTTSSSTLQTLKSVTVTAGRVGLLRSIELSCSHYEIAQFKLTVGGTVVQDTNYIPESFSKDFPDLHLVAAKVILVQVKSDGTTPITAYCDINYKEIG